MTFSNVMNKIVYLLLGNIVIRVSGLGRDCLESW